jgi:hypothetical protein
MYLDSGDYSSKQHLNTGRPCTFTDKEGNFNIERLDGFKLIPYL